MFNYKQEDHEDVDHNTLKSLKVELRERKLSKQKNSRPTTRKSSHIRQNIQAINKMFEEECVSETPSVSNNSISDKSRNKSLIEKLEKQNRSKANKLVFNASERRKNSKEEKLESFKFID